MPSCSKAKNPRGVELTFIESDHSYKSLIDGKEISYISVTTILGKYFPPFDPTGEITKRCAIKEGISVEELQAKWKKKGADSCNFGTRVHECCEDIELGRDLRNKPANEREEKTFPNAVKMAQKLRQSIDIIGVEKLVFDDRLQIAGTIDLLGKSRKNGDYLIIDHKTNEKIEQFNTFKKFCLEPISHIADISYYHYALQLSLYQYLLKFGGYIPKDAKVRLFLNHITTEGTKLIELPSLQSEIKDVIIDFLMRKDEMMKR